MEKNKISIKKQKRLNLMFIESSRGIYWILFVGAICIVVLVMLMLLIK